MSGSDEDSNAQEDQGQKYDDRRHRPLVLHPKEMTERLAERWGEAWLPEISNRKSEIARLGCERDGQIVDLGPTIAEEQQVSRAVVDIFRLPHRLPVHRHGQAL